MTHSLCRTTLLLILLGRLSLCSQPVAPAGDAPPLRISSDFPGGSAKVLSIDPDNNTVHITPADDPKRGLPCWWYFRLDGVDTNRPLTLEVTANQGIVQTGVPGQTRACPADFSLPAYAAFSLDGTNWEHTKRGERRGNRSTYQVAASQSTLWLAWGPPFTLKDASQLIDQACARCPYASRFVLAHTRGGRPVPGMRIAQPGAAGSPRYGVWIQARQHAWESGSSWVAQGFVEWLISNDPAAESLRQKADIVVIPIMDVDCVEEGQGGKEQIPHDQDEDWHPKAYFPEVAAGMRSLYALAKADRLDLMLDLHNPGYSGHEIEFYVAPTILLPPERVANEQNFFNIVKEQMTGAIKFTGKIGPDNDTYDPVMNKCVDAWTAAQSRPYVVSLTMETPWNISAGTQAGYVKTGGQLGRSISLYLQATNRPSAGK